MLISFKRFHQRQRHLKQQTHFFKVHIQVEELVAAAYRAAAQETRNRLLAALLASKILEDWLTISDRLDLLRQLEATFS